MVCFPNPLPSHALVAMFFATISHLHLMSLAVLSAIIRQASGIGSRLLGAAIFAQAVAMKLMINMSLVSILARKNLIRNILHVELRSN